MEAKRSKILAIDDNPDNLISLKALIMEAFPAAVALTALNGRRGIELAAAEDPDVILLDIVMPDMDGFEVCRRLKADSKLCDIPVIFVTALKGDKDSRIRALESGAEAFLAKPIDESELTAQIQAMVKIKAANIEKRDEKRRLAALVEVQIRELKETHKATLNLLDDLKKENEARKISEEKLQDKNTELERFTYTVSHDLKSPLITIQTYAGMIRQDMAAGNFTTAGDDLRRIEEAAAKMNNLLDDLLELSRIGRQMNPPSMIDMNRLVMDTMLQLDGIVKKSRIEVVVQPDLPAVYGDRKRIAEVVQNLIENAVKYIGDHAKPRIEIGFTQEDKELTYFVSDNGIGIDQRFQERIFGLFNKLDAKSEGTGVGLALVKRIVELHGGRIWVESEGAGKGSRFCFSLPDNQNGSIPRISP